MARTIKLAFVLSLVWLWAGVNANTVSSVAAQEAITFTNFATENGFPDGVTFQVDVSSSAGDITGARLFLTPRESVSTERIEVEVTTVAAATTISYTWDTSNMTVPPSTPFYYVWEVTDSAGNRVQSEEQLFFYDDINFDWQILEDESIAVWWYDRPASFGEEVFNIAQRAFERQKAMYQAELDIQIRIIIYNDAEDFAGWHVFVNEWVGGQAFPSAGVTTQIVGAYDDYNRWLRDVIPHEISHLYFHQATYHALSNPPRWLDEGLAQYHEFDWSLLSLEHAQREIAAGNLITLKILEGSFGNKTETVRLSYAEAFSAVVYLVETYGEEGLSALLRAYHEGESHADAMEMALGVTPIDFQQDWLEWLGVDLALYPTPAPTPTFAWPPTPTYAVFQTPTPAATRTPRAEAATPAAEITEEATEADTGGEPEVTETAPGAGRPPFCGGAAMLTLVGMAWVSRRKQKTAIKPPKHPIL